MVNPNAKNAKALWGTTRAILNNAVSGVATGFSKKMILEGVGYRAELKGNDLQLNLGFSHPVIVKQIPGITFAVEKNTITVSGIDKELVGQTAAVIRAYKKPEPYKGKWIHYDNEIVRRKAGKKASS
jgi:large subunit ribosomal protein L6